jgi:2-polyprenyl-3-methyl-5-hydroxy-6-metoxy-1,4-benzoquinol methylase
VAEIRQFLLTFSDFLGTKSSFFPSTWTQRAMNQDEILRANRKVYDAMAAAEAPLCRPATDQELANPLATVDPAGWLGKSIAGKNLLCLAAGGGRQSSLYAAAGAIVTVVDLSGAMLELDRQMAARRRYSLRLLETSMEDLSMLEDREFDIVIHPVSTCYVPRVQPVFREIARVIRPRGIYISQHKQPTSLQASIEPAACGGYTIQHRYYRDGPVPAPEPASRAGRRLRESGAIEFLHRWEQIIGGMCRAGFLIEDLSEPMHAKQRAEKGSFADRATYIAPYVRIKARRVGSGGAGQSLWLP